MTTVYYPMDISLHLWISTVSIEKHTVLPLIAAGRFVPMTFTPEFLITLGRAAALGAVLYN